MGIDSLAKLAKADPNAITEQAATLVGSSCWKNSPQAKAAIDRAINFAQGYIKGNKSL